jgi:hypothetical protein
LSAVTFYLDADSANPAVVRPLRQHAIAVETAVEAGLRTALDAQQIAHVLATGRVLVTGDHDLRDQLAALTRQGGHHPGVLFLPARKRNQIGAIVFSLRLVHAIYSAEEMVDRVEFIPY